VESGFARNVGTGKDGSGGEVKGRGRGCAYTSKRCAALNRVVYSACESRKRVYMNRMSLRSQRHEL
jgi:hypothetical protein